MYTARRVLERDRNWNSVQNTNLHLRNVRNPAKGKN